MNVFVKAGPWLSLCWWAREEFLTQRGPRGAGHSMAHLRLSLSIPLASSTAFQQILQPRLRLEPVLTQELCPAPCTHPKSGHTPSPFWCLLQSQILKLLELIQSCFQFLNTSIFKTYRQDFFKIKCFWYSTKCSSPIPCVMQIGSQIE